MDRLELEEMLTVWTLKHNYLLIPLNEMKMQHGELQTAMPRNMLEGFHYRNHSYPNEHDEVNARKYINDLLEAGHEKINYEREKQQMKVPEVTIQNTQGTNFGRNTTKRSNNVGCEEQSKQNKSNHLQNSLLGVKRNKSRPSSAASSRYVPHDYKTLQPMNKAIVNCERNQNLKIIFTL